MQTRKNAKHPWTFSLYQLILKTGLFVCMYIVCPFDEYPPLAIRPLVDTKGQASNYNKKKPVMQGITGFFSYYIKLILVQQ